MENTRLIGYIWCDTTCRKSREFRFRCVTTMQSQMHPNTSILHNQRIEEILIASNVIKFAFYLIEGMVQWSERRCSHRLEIRFRAAT